MKKSTYTLTKYENIVEDIIADVLEAYRGLYSIEASESSHGGWEAEIVPINPKAAKIYISDIDDSTIYTAIDDTYFLEFHLNKTDYEKGLSDFRLHIQAALCGDIVGYHVKNMRDFASNPYMKTVLDFEIKNSVIPHSRNVLFRKIFIKRNDVVKQNFESY